MKRWTGHEIRTRWFGLVAALLVMSTLAPPALAGTSRVSQTIRCGGSGNMLTASIVDLTLEAVEFAPKPRETIGAVTLTAGEAGCIAAGWNVTIQSGDWAKVDGGTPLPAANFSLMTVSGPSVVAGQPIDTRGGPKLVNQIGNLGQPRKVLQANPGHGLGSYEQVLGVKLAIPAFTRPGDYRALVTATIQTGP